MSERNAIPTLPGRLAELRRAAGFSQLQLADAAGTAKDTIAKLERGDRSPSLELAGRIADALGVPVDALRQAAGTPAKKLGKK